MNTSGAQNMNWRADTLSSLRINEDRLWQSLMTLAQIGGTEKGGVCRLALTELDRQGRDLVSSICPPS